jgi:low affinity Fe/Cu permease
VTVVMVFVLQHTQRREQLAFQLKLDELVHASPGADDRLVAVEASSDDEILGLEERRIEQHVAARQDGDA